MNNRAGTVVVAEDDPNIADLLRLYLEREGYAVVVSDNAEEALELIEREHPRLVVLDVALSGAMNGLEACRAIRSRSMTPVIMLTARDTEVDRVLGLELGADDYVTKPFSPRELVARIKAILRRAEPSTDPNAVLIYGSIEVDLGRREVRVSGEAVDLTNREFDLLAYLVSKPGLALSRRQILDGAWEPGWYGDERTVDVHVRQLRKKLGNSLSLNTVWGVGYRLS